MIWEGVTRKMHQNKACEHYQSTLITSVNLQNICIKDSTTGCWKHQTPVKKWMCLLTLPHQRIHALMWIQQHPHFPKLWSRQICSSDIPMNGCDLSTFFLPLQICLFIHTYIHTHTHTHTHNPSCPTQSSLFCFKCLFSLQELHSCWVGSYC